MTQQEVLEHGVYFTMNNIELLKIGEEPITLEIVGDAGMSKSSICIQIGKEIEKREKKSVGIKMLNGAELGTDTGPLMGFPVVEHLYSVDGAPEWVSDDAVKFLDVTKCVSLNQHRTVNGRPDWVQELEEYDYSILVLDDIGRCQQILFNALMELMLHRRYDSWSLPPNCLVFCTANHDHNSQNVAEQDDAQKTRKRTIKLTSIDINSWVENYGQHKLNPFYCAFAQQYWGLNLGASLRNNIRQYTQFCMTTDSALNDFIATMQGDRAKVFKGKDLSEDKHLALKYIKIEGEHGLSTEITNTLINDFLTKMITSITNIEKEYGKKTAYELVQSLKVDTKNGSNVIISNLQLKRIFNLLQNKNKKLTKEESEYLIDVICAADLFKPTSLTYYNNTVLSKGIFAEVRNNNKLNERFLSTAMSL